MEMPYISSLKISENGKNILIFADFSNMEIGKMAGFRPNPDSQPFLGLPALRV
jgi:hypothetical protein